LKSKVKVSCLGGKETIDLLIL